MLRTAKRPNYARLALILCLTLGLLLAACGPRDSSQRLDSQSQSGTSISTFAALGNPSELARQIRSGNTVMERAGGDYAAVLPSARIAAESISAPLVLTPDGSQGGLAGVAYCIYDFVPDSQALPLLQLQWAHPPALGAAWIGLSEWGTDRWHWFKLDEAAQLPLGDLAPYENPVGGALMAAVVIGAAEPCTLNKIEIPTLAADYVPDGPRPRLWLTPERLAGLKAARDANTPEWQRFSNESQMYLTDEFWGELINLTIPFTLLMYEMTGESKWADRSMELMDQSPLDEWQISCCPYHNQIHNIALGYDWLYDYPGMTAEKKAAYREKMLTLADHLWVDALNSDGLSNSQDTDRVTMAGASLLMIGCALWGDDPRAPEIYERGWRMWNKGLGTPPANGVCRQWTDASPVRRWATQFGHGPWPSGWFYSSGTDLVGLKDYFTTLRTACGYDPSVLEPGMDTIWRDQIRCFIYGMDPKRSTTYSGADWQESDLFENYNNAYMHSCLAALADEASQAGDTQEASYARWLARNLPGAHSASFREFFFTPGASPEVTNPFTAGLPLVAFSAGMPNYMYFRDGWDTQARWGIFGGQSGVPCDHPQMDQGHFSLVRGGEYLTRDAPGYKEFSIGAQTYNTMAIENSNEGGYPHNSNFNTPAQIQRRRSSESPLLAYSMLESAGQFNEDPLWWESDQRVQAAQRHFFWSGDYAVVFDRVRRTDVGWAHARLRSQTPQTVNGDTITQLSEDGSQKLMQKTLEPAGCSFTSYDEKVLFASVENWQIDSSYRKYQTVIAPPDTDSLDMLNVIRMGDSSLAGFDANLQHITGNGNSGVLIGPCCVVFGSETALRSSVSYSVDNAMAGTKHLVCDLTPGTYTVTISGEASQQVAVADGDNTAFFTTAGSGALTITIE